MIKHEFYIIDEIDVNIDYISNKPLDSDCVLVDDNSLNELYENVSIMRTYWNNSMKNRMGINRWGITIIPPESMSIFYENAINIKKYSDDLSDLCNLILEAVQKNKYIICYGI